MKLTDLEIATLLDGIHCQDSQLGLNQTGLGVLNRLSAELRNRGYSFSSTDIKPVFEKVLEQMDQ